MSAGSARRHGAVGGRSTAKRRRLGVWGFTPRESAAGAEGGAAAPSWLVFSSFGERLALGEEVSVKRASTPTKGAEDLALFSSFGATQAPPKGKTRVYRWRKGGPAWPGHW